MRGVARLNEAQTHRRPPAMLPSLSFLRFCHGSAETTESLATVGQPSCDHALICVVVSDAGGIFPLFGSRGRFSGVDASTVTSGLTAIPQSPRPRDPLPTTNHWPVKTFMTAASAKSAEAARLK
jgi:hypothetical protein